MKKLALFSILIIAASGIIHAQTVKECSVYTQVKPVLIPKGGSIVYKKPEQPQILGNQLIKARSTKAGEVCSISLYNYNSQLIHVYLDSVYAGSVAANSVGVINNISGDADMYCITDDQEYSWEDIADCSCKLTFHLRIKKGEGEIKQ
jgi:hypothetical protein